jgi:hypothetical protein
MTVIFFEGKATSRTYVKGLQQHYDWWKDIKSVNIHFYKKENLLLSTKTSGKSEES